MTDAKNFALIGAAGYIAPRHLQAIKDTGNVLVAALDPNDSGGVIDRWFPDADFFTEFERFDRHLEKLRRSGASRRVSYVSIASPNYLHDAHVRVALRVQADAICEKPLVLRPWNLDALAELEAESGHRVWCVLQLRHHPAIIALRERVRASGGRHRVDLTYLTPRGRWYGVSWKGNKEKSGGVAMNIGVHFFDMLQWIFGPPRRSAVHHADERSMAGSLDLERADVRWFLSVDRGDLALAGRPEAATHRELMIDGDAFEFSEGFTDLHTTVYRETLAGRGHGIADARPAIELVHGLDQAAAAGGGSDEHPLVGLVRLARGERS